ncbi:hypothetical protein IMCC9480_1327 [Oxalobacteraceae bacterium IMCC9480]|nr:hypothetical protein IMCC9480_1327 [Oxalobacteraceae bacterium IMCC9480]
MNRQIGVKRGTIEKVSETRPLLAILDELVQSKQVTYD